MSNTLDHLVAHGARDAGAVRARRSAGAADRSHRTGREHRRRRVVRHELGQPHAARQQAVPSRQQPVASGRRARASGSASISSTTTTRSPIHASVRGSYSFSSLANFLAGVYNNAGFTQTFGVSEVSQTNPNIGYLRAGRVESASSRDAQRWASVTTCSSSRRSTRTPTTSRRAWAWPGHRSSRAVRSCAAARDCSTIACRCARWPTPSSRRATRRIWQTSADRREPLAGAGGRAGVPEYSAGRRPVGHAGQPHDHGPASAERLLAAGQPRSRAPDRRARDDQRRLSVSARPATC